MMFPSQELSEGLPRFETRSALLVLDLQNDFLAPECPLPVHSPLRFLQGVKDVITAFRTRGDIIWVRSEFEASRPVSQDGAGRRVITHEHVAAQSDGKIAAKPKADLLSRMMARQAGGAKKGVEKQVAVFGGEEADEDAFLTVSEKDAAICVRGSRGAEFIEDAQPLIDHDRDLVFTKTHYSAFEDTELLPHLRSNIVTELYVCGLMSNVSVFATTLDAARHGYSMNLIEDCLGYRSREKHTEAVRQMTEYAGADVTDARSLLKELNPPKPAANRIMDGNSKSPLRGRGTPSRSRLGSPLNSMDGRKAQDDSDSPDEPESAGPALEADSADDSDASGKSKNGDSGGGGEVPSMQFYLQKVRQKTQKRKSFDEQPEEGGAVSMRPLARVESKSKSPKRPELSVEERAEGDAGSRDGEAESPVVKERPRERSIEPVGGSQSPGTPRREYRRIRNRMKKPNQPAPLLGAGDHIGEGDSSIVLDLLEESLSEHIFEKVKDEVKWKTMHHRGGEVPRLVAVQGSISGDGSFPVYRHPSDEAPPLLAFTPTVMVIKEAVEEKLGQPVNHVLIQHYRHGHDYISEHSDKTLDIVRGSSIVNVSLGAQRSMTLRTKSAGKARPVSRDSAAESSKSPAPELQSPKPESGQDEASRSSQKINMPHNSMFVLGQISNMRWLHGIRQDKRPTSSKGETELAFGGERISLTFRHIGTFLDRQSKNIWGQGARSKKRESPHPCINGETEEGSAMIRAFGRENQQSEFDWEAVYGEGFDALHTSHNPPRLFVCGDPLSDIRVKLQLAECGVDWEPGVAAAATSGGWASSATTGALQQGAPESHDPQPYKMLRLVDNDVDRTEIAGVFAILMYVELYYKHGGDLNVAYSRPELGEMLTRVGQSNDLLMAWRGLAPILTKPEDPESVSAPDDDTREQREEADRLLARELELWEGIASRTPFIGGKLCSMGDAAVWPVLREVVLLAPTCLTEARFPSLMKYYRRYEARESVRKTLG